MGANGSSEVADFRAKYGSSAYAQGMYMFVAIETYSQCCRFLL